MPDSACPIECVRLAELNDLWSTSNVLFLFLVLVTMKSLQGCIYVVSQFVISMCQKLVTRSSYGPHSIITKK